jgi:tetratricopeptide (TPR) repeat protein
MPMNLDDILSRGDYQIPLFADFILEKYRDLKQRDPESASKIETQVFTRSFLLNFLDKGDLFMKNLLFTQVPPQFFAPIMDELVDRYKNGSLSDHGRNIEVIIKANAPDLFLTLLKEKLQESIKEEPATINTFHWYNHFDDLPQKLRREYFEKTHPLFLGARDVLAEKPHFHALLSSQTSAALLLDRPEAIPLAKQHLEYLAQAYGEGEMDYYDLCRSLRRVLTLERFETCYLFELDLFFDLENGELTSPPELLDHLYQEGWNDDRLFDLYTALIQSENLYEKPLILEQLNIINEPLLTSIIRTLIQDKALMLLLESHHLHHAVLAVFASIIWQFHRKEKLDSTRFSHANVMEFIAIDSNHLPCMAQIKTYLSGIPRQSSASLLKAALDKGIEGLDREEQAGDAVINIMELMADFRDPSFVPGLIKVFLHDPGDNDDRLIGKASQVLSWFGDAAINSLDSMMEDIPQTRLLDLLTLIRRIGTQGAEALLIKNFDRFIRHYRPDTLSVCQSLVSQKALALLTHKVGKNQKGVDELHVIVKTLQGKADGKTQRILDTLPNPGEALNAAMDLIRSDTARSVLILALECTHCGDISDYECLDIITSPQGGAYVADELTCISCNEISEFTLAPMGQLEITAELLRLTTLKSQDESYDSPLTGALRILNTAVMGKQMSLAQGIELYKEKIRKKPKTPDHYIGLGNIYKSLKQYTFAEKHYKEAIVHGPFYIEPYLSLAEIAKDKGEFHTALDWLEKGRLYLKRPVICKDINVTAEEIMESYLSFHFGMVKKTSRRITPILPSEYRIAGKRLDKIGRNEKCPCGSGKKYKKCCMNKR